ncbi:hypothetical protein C1H76_7532 [Elsinoe australis]|uniref:Uncharacterized protein n=1 Tax=Elsinoe australis TaxID=40998 RepID=A0A4U7AQV0_9PEZI|nr:hypothetical protein C1H76_7532 [Elsinoe australis]
MLILEQASPSRLQQPNTSTRAANPKYGEPSITPLESKSTVSILNPTYVHQRAYPELLRTSSVRPHLSKSPSSMSSQTQLFPSMSDDLSIPSSFIRQRKVIKTRISTPVRSTTSACLPAGPPTLPHLRHHI